MDATKWLKQVEAQIVLPWVSSWLSIDKDDTVKRNELLKQYWSFTKGERRVVMSKLKEVYNQTMYLHKHLVKKLKKIKNNSEMPSPYLYADILRIHNPEICENSLIMRCAYEHGSSTPYPCITVINIKQKFKL